MGLPGCSRARSPVTKLKSKNSPFSPVRQSLNGCDWCAMSLALATQRRSWALSASMPKHCQAHGVVHEVLVRKVMVPVGDILEDHDNTLGKRMAKKGPHLQGVFAHPPLASDDFQNRNAWLLEM